MEGMKRDSIAESPITPLLALPARLGWELVSTPIFGSAGSNQPSAQNIRFLPALDCGLYLAGEYQDIVLDLAALLESARKPGGYFLLNCECGYPDDADIHELIFVQHPTPDSIVWELDVQGLRSALSKETWLTHQNGYVRLIFERKQYETDLRRMVLEVKQAHASLELNEVAPNDYGFTEFILTFDQDEPFVAEPILPPGSHLEFGFEGSELCWINGNRWDGWPTRLFPCWQVNQAFKAWVRFVQRGFAIKDGAQSLETNHFYLLDENSRAACDMAGYALAEQLQACIARNVNQPEIVVSYQGVNAG